MCSCHSILECCVTFSGVKLSIRSFLLFRVYRKMSILNQKFKEDSREDSGKSSP